MTGTFLLPEGIGLHPVVIIVPGSAGVSEDHLKHAKELVRAGFGVYVLDPHSARGIKNPISNRNQITWATSTYDVLAALRMLSEQPGLDPKRIGALGYSRGGTAVLLAASRQLTGAMLGEGQYLKAVLAAWPWCGFQFERPVNSPTAVRFLVGDSDNVASPIQCQGQAYAMKALNPNVFIRLFKGAYHGFGYYENLQNMSSLVKATDAPTVYINDQGAFLDFYTGQPIPGETADEYITRLLAPWREQGTAMYGSKSGQTEAFLEDMIGFFKGQL